jgi:hypothetical protein
MLQTKSVSFSAIRAPLVSSQLLPRKSKPGPNW